MPHRNLTASPTHSIWDNSLPPRLHITSGEQVAIQCVDASGAQVHPGMTVDQYLAIDRTRIHALTGPIWIEDAVPGDVLEVNILSTQHHGWGWSSIVEGLGFLKDRFRKPYLFHWSLDGNQTTSLSPATVPLRPFLGVMGVARGDAGSFRTRPPGPFGGNLDVRELSAGATLYLPVFVPGALFSCGDGHAAQGDGEVCINGIECPLDTTLRFRLHKNQPLTSPIVEAAPDITPASPSGEWLIVETGPSLEDAAHAATSRMVDLLVGRWSLSPQHAYILCSVAMKLRLSQVVNEPIHTVTAAISKHILPARRLFPAT
jgi:acetamidase/formamidase